MLSLHPTSPSKVEVEPASRSPATGTVPWQGLRVAALAVACAVVFFGVVLIAYEMAVARVPQHRAALERLVRAQTGLEVHFDELDLRWGWYGPEAVFRRVELGEPGRATVLLRAPELVVGFDLWQTLRSGQLAAARITLVAADIDLGLGKSDLGVGRVAGGGYTPGARYAAGGARGAGANQAVPGPAAGGPIAAPVANGIRILEGWQGGRVDLEGGTLRLPDPAGSNNPLVLQIRRASLRRSVAPSTVSAATQVPEWSGYGLVFLPERLGRTARLVVRLDGNLERAADLSGTVRFEGRRLAFAGWRELLSAVPDAQRYLPSAGGGDIALSVDFAGGRVAKASGKVSAGGLEFVAADAPLHTVFNLDHIRGDWQLAQRHDSGWRLQVDSLELGAANSHAAPASLELDAAPSGTWVHGTLEEAPLQSVAAVARWFAPQLDVSGVELGGTVRNVAFDWNESRPAGERLRTTARLVDVAVAPLDHGFTLSGLSGVVSSDERNLVVDVKTHTARLELAQAPQYPLDGVQVDARLQINRMEGAWRITTEKLELQHEATALHIEGSLTGAYSSAAPEINAHAELTGADVPLLERLAGASMAQTFGATFSQLTAGRIERAQIELRGPLDETLPETGFSGALLLRSAVLGGGDLWPDAHDVDARIDWHGPRMRALIDRGHAGAFTLTNARAEWDVRGDRETHLAGHVSGPVEEAIAWMRSHPKLQQYAPRVQSIEMRGAASLDFNVALPADFDASNPAAADVQARVTAMLNGTQLEVVAGMPPMESLHGTLVFDSGTLRRTTLTGSWLGGPVTLSVGERRDHGTPVLSIQGHGVLDARHLALAATAGTVIDQSLAPTGNAQWTGELTYLAGNDSRPAQWRVKADSSLVGITSHLPEPLAKMNATVVPLHVEVQGAAAAAELHLRLGDRMNSLLSMRRRDDTSWRVERGAVRFGTTPAVLPMAPVVLVDGRLNRLDLPAYVAAWQQLRREPDAPAIRADLLAGEMLVAGRGYPDVHVVAERTDVGANLELHSPDIAGTAYWPAVNRASRPAQFHFTRLNVPDGSAFAASAELIAALGPATEFSVEDLVWQGHSLGSMSATIQSGGSTVDVTDLHLTDSSQDLNGSMHCQSTTCRLKFTLDSRNGAATLEDFGFRPELTAAKATLDGDLQWQVGDDRPPLATLAGRLNMHLEDGVTRADPDPHPEGTPFALLLVPALVSGIGHLNTAGQVSAMAQGDEGAQGQGSPLPVSEPRALRFARLDGDFEFDSGEAVTSNLHFDGDAEILMRGRTGLLTRDYDQQVWILKGEGRLPAAVRRLDPTPRVAAAWLSLRDLFAGGGREESARAPFHLQGSWDAPIVVAAD